MAELEVHVVSPEREVFTGSAEMVVAKGADGDVGILPGHAPMLISLAVAPVRVLQGEAGTQTVLVGGGFLHVTPGDPVTRVEVLAEHADLPEEVDAAAARRRADELEQRLEREEEAELKGELARALMHAEHGTA